MGTSPPPDRPEVADDVLDRLRSICLALPEVVEEEAWVGTRWVIRKKNFAHVLVIADGWPPAYARAAGSAGPRVVLTFRTPEPEFYEAGRAEDPFFYPGWFRDLVGLVLDGTVGWDEIGELITDSYCLLAPRRLAAQVCGARD
ncbi:MAG TPA: MmcQ/YjbR family DNA-binding protein [Ilumatobacteraceae bacterium]